MTRREIALASTLLLVLAVAGAPRLARGAPAGTVRSAPALGGGVCAPGDVRATPLILVADAEASDPVPKTGATDRRARRSRFEPPCITLAGPPTSGTDSSQASGPAIPRRK